MSNYLDECTKIMATIKSINNFGTSPLKYYCFVDTTQCSNGRPLYLLYAVPVSHKEICAMNDFEFFEDMNVISKYYVRESYSSASMYRYLDVIFCQCLHLCRFSGF